MKLPIIPRGRFDRSTSSTMSTVCSISMLHSDRSSGHTKRTSIAILCHEASKSLCPSSRLAIPALPLHGSSFRKGVKFSVQTTSLGKVPCKRKRLSDEASVTLLAGSNVMRGLVVRVESMKLSEAQNRPERALLRVTHLANELPLSQSIFIYLNLFSVPSIRVCFYPSPELYPCPSLFRSSPWPCAPTLIVPSPSGESQMKLSRLCML